MNSYVNPVIYFWRNKELRIAMKSLVTRWTKRRCFALNPADSFWSYLAFKVSLYDQSWMYSRSSFFHFQVTNVNYSGRSDSISFAFKRKRKENREGKTSRTWQWLWCSHLVGSIEHDISSEQANCQVRKYKQESTPQKRKWYAFVRAAQNTQKLKLPC